MRKPKDAQSIIPEGRRGWWGGPDMRDRCSFDDLVVFSSQEKAEASAERIRNNPNTRAPAPDMNAFQGKCGFWHVGRKRKKGRSAWSTSDTRGKNA